jgi:hypothetical protein
VGHEPLQAEGMAELVAPPSELENLQLPPKAA